MRGLGGRIKRRVVRNLVTTEDVELLPIQETKANSINRDLCAFIWGDRDMEWEAWPALNNAGGLVFIWKNDCFQLDQVFPGQGFLGLRGKWKGFDCMIVNVYSPCSLGTRRGCGVIF